MKTDTEVYSLVFPFSGLRAHRDWSNFKCIASPHLKRASVFIHTPQIKSESGMSV